MEKIMYLIKRIFNMDYSNFFNKINKISNKTKRNKLLVLLDVIYCGLKYQAGYIDYDLFEMYNLNSKQRKTIITRGINNSIVKKLNNLKFNEYFNNKVKFNEVFNDYLNRSWLYIDNNYEEFKEFIKDKDEIFCKPLDLSCGVGIEKINVKNKDSKTIFDYLTKNNILLVEELALQHQLLNDLHPTSINTIRVVTINNGKDITVVAAFLRIGNNNNIIDNFNNDGLTSKVDIKAGIIKVPAIDKKQNLYTKHPITNKDIIGFEIPAWDEVLDLCINAAKVIPEMGYIAWDVCVGIEKPYLIEGNEFPGHDLYQLPPHRENNIGLYPEFKKAIERGIK